MKVTICDLCKHVDRHPDPARRIEVGATRLYEDVCEMCEKNALKMLGTIDAPMPEDLKPLVPDAPPDVPPHDFPRATIPEGWGP